MPSAWWRPRRRLNRKLVVGYILRHHPSWVRLIAEARALGGPYVFRMNLNQQSSGAEWDTHKALMQTTSPIVDCGVHYVDVMCQITDARPVRVQGIGLRLSDEIAPDMYNYGQFQVVFEDGSVGWYEAGWGPMMSETAFFVKDIVSPTARSRSRMPTNPDPRTSTGTPRSAGCWSTVPGRRDDRPAGRARPPGALRRRTGLRARRHRRRTST
jgi:predicted dehydrogenase